MCLGRSEEYRLSITTDEKTSVSRVNSVFGKCTKLGCSRVEPFVLVIVYHNCVKCMQELVYTVVVCKISHLPSHNFIQPTL